MTSDNELLRRYAEGRSESAFAELVERHVNLVYSAALRQVNGDAHLAQDVAQIVFTDLARQAAPLWRRAVLTGWLYSSAHFAAAKAARSEHRRHAHEQEAQTMSELLHDSAPELDWDKLRPVLDEAMHELKEADREAILLRYFEKRPFGEVGARLGLSENAARMRVDRAVEKLRALLARRGVTTAAAALSTVISANAVQAAPAGVAAGLSSAALAGALAGTGTAVSFLKLMTMTKLQVGIASAIAVAAVAAPLVLVKQAQLKSLSADNQALRQQASRASQLEADNNRLSNLVAPASPQALSNDQYLELLRLRGEVGRLRGDSQELAKLKADPTGALDRVAKIKARLQQMPEEWIPELQFLTEQEWDLYTSGVFGKGETDEDYRYAFSRLREKAKELFVRWLGQALHNYAKANDGFLPADLSQLKPYFTPPAHDPNWKPGQPRRYELLPVDDAILQRYQLVQTGKLSDVPQVGYYPPGSNTNNVEREAQNAAQQTGQKSSNLPWTAPVVVEKAPVDSQFDSLFTVTVYGYSYKTFGRGNGSGSGTFAKGVVGTNGVPEMVDPPTGVGRTTVSGGGMGGGFGGGSGGGGGGFGGGG
jgi:RNA polymerase sigma factor (sigma-70 family)